MTEIETRIWSRRVTGNSRISRADEPRLYELCIVYEHGCGDDVPFEANSLEDAVEQVIKWLPESRDDHNMRLIHRAYICELAVHRLSSPLKTGAVVASVNVLYFTNNHKDAYQSDRDLWMDGQTLDNSPHMSMEGVVS